MLITSQPIRYNFRQLRKWIASTSLISSTLFGAVTEDEAKIQKISDLRTCFDTFRGILQEGIQMAEPSYLAKAQGATDDVFSLIHFFQSNQQDMEYVSWELYPKFVRAYSLLHGSEIEPNMQFFQNGFLQGKLDDCLNQNFIDALQQAKQIPIMEEDHDPNYAFTSLYGTFSGLSGGIDDFLNDSHSYFMLDEAQLKALEPILQSLKQPISQCMRTPWRVASLRVWETYPGDIHSNDLKIGPNNWHTDGFPLSALKIMIYPLGISSEIGTTEFQLPTGHYAPEGEPGTWIFFKNSEIVHRGIAPKINKRLSIEVTILPSLEYDFKPIAAGLNARFPIFPWMKPHVSSLQIYKKGDVIGLNIGGGPNWQCPGWGNLEEVTSPSNPHSFLLYPNCRFPSENESIPTIYTSHNLEHLNTATVYRVLSECSRTLVQNGNLVIKIPDFDRALDCWKRQDSSFFGPGWNIESVTGLWKNEGICDCLNHRAAMIFCSFFNDACGNPFDSPTYSDGAYFGPPLADVAYLQELIQNRSPSQITKELRNLIKKDSKLVKKGLYQHSPIHFCHQSAWSRDELKALLESFDFEIVSFDPPVVIEAFKSISGIAEMKDLSTFCWARKRH